MKTPIDISNEIENDRFMDQHTLKEMTKKPGWDDCQDPENQKGSGFSTRVEAKRFRNFSGLLKRLD